jgi:hypothetical protein
MTTMAKRPAEEGFGAGIPIDVSGVEEGNPGIQRRVDYGGAFMFIEARSEIITPEPDRADLRVGGT